MHFFPIIATLLLALQITCLVISIKNNIEPMEVLNGFAIWGCVPVVIFANIPLILK